MHFLLCPPNIMFIYKHHVYSLDYEVFSMRVQCEWFVSGRTEFQTASMTSARRSVRFERRPSQRYSRRPNFEPVRQDAEKATSAASTDNLK